MSADDVLFEPIRTSSEIDAYREKMWQLYLDIIPPEIDVDSLLSSMSQTEIDAMRQNLFNRLDWYGNPFIENANQLRDLVDAPP